METEEFFRQPYSNRQLVLFVEDAAIAASEATTKSYEDNSSREPKKRSFWSNVVVGYTIASLPGAIALGGMDIYTRFIKADIQTIKSSNEAKEQGVENLILVGKSKTPLFQLPPGHPRNRIVYAGHPAIPEVYVPLADFHRLTFEHKFSEVISLLMHLGARTIKVEYVTGWGTDFSSRLNVGLPSAVPLEIGAEAKANQQNKQTLLYEANLENSQSPRLPDNLVWYPYESTWQQVANGRLKFGLKNFNLSLSYNDDYGINAGIKFKIDRVGLDAGGTFERHTATTWRIYGHF